MSGRDIGWSEKEGLGSSMNLDISDPESNPPGNQKPEIDKQNAT